MCPVHPAGLLSAYPDDARHRAPGGGPGTEFLPGADNPAEGTGRAARALPLRRQRVQPLPTDEEPLMEEALALDHLRPTDLPAPPQAALQIVQACSRPDIDARRLGEFITRDPVLTAELLRVANSAFFGFRSQVRSAAHAVALLGQRALRNLALCIAMRDALRKEAIPGMPLDRFWEAALRRAVCARALADIAGLDVDECFTAGLLQDFGLLVLFYLYPDRVSEWARLEAANPDDRLELERQLFGHTHEQAGQALAAAWGLPEDLAAAIGHHHAPVFGELSGEIRQLCRVARCADWMAAVFSAADKRIVYARCGKVLDEHFDLDADAIDGLLDGVGEAIAEAASLLGFRIDRQPALEEVLREANLRLAEENLSFQELTWRLQQTLAERDALAAELDRELALAREVQCALLPRRSTPEEGVLGLNLSARQVSGDFYDHFTARDGWRYFAIADVSGKGMHAALLMAKTSSLFHCLGKGVTDPSALLAMLNRELSENAIRGMFVTMAAGIFDPETGRGRLANAGHLPVLQLRGDGAFREWPASGPPLGVLPDSRYENLEFRLEEGALYLFTDGVTEARQPGGGELGLGGLKRLIREHAGAPLERRLHQILHGVQGRQESATDDLTLLVVDSGALRGGNGD